ncbi:MAG: hypothetical protein RLZZ385_2153 [Pseudomonadota bacterium]|jgi:predicted DCC family thiol-disulfide oxidoreductase YuxK
MDLTIFYDGHCPLCVAEMRQLSELDRHRRLHLQDLHAADFVQRYPHIDPQAAIRILHGQLADGTLLYGLDVSCRAWALVGRHGWLRILRWPVIRWFADAAYRVFARNRGLLAFLLTGKSRCTACNLESGRHCDS